MPALDDPARLQALERSELLDRGAEEVFDRLTRLAGRLVGAPISLLTLLDGEHQYVKGATGEVGPPVPAAQSFCQYVVRDDAPFTVTDVREDPRIADSSALVEAGLITYCGVPVVDSDGHTLGTLCAMGAAPRRWSQADVEVLHELAITAMTEVQLRLANRRLRDREREAAALHESQARLAGIVDAAEEAINLVDLDGRVTGWNTACERLYGWAREEVLGRPLTEIGFLVAETDDQDGFALDARALAGESVAAKRLKRRRKDGGVVYVDISLTPLRDSAGEIIGVTAVARDVTDRHRLSLELEASERRFRHTFDRAPTGVTLVGLDRRLLDANRAFCEIVGYDRDELIGRTLEGITHPDDLGNDLGGARSMVAGEIQQYTIEKRYRHKSGRLVWVRLSASLVRGEEGDPRYFIAHTEDITLARSAQLALEDARALLDESQAVAHVGSWSYDLDTGAVSWSREQYHLHGVSPDVDAPSVTGLLELVVAEDREALRHVLEGLVSQPRAFSGEYRVQLPDGTARTLWTSAAVLEADPARGRRARVSGTTRDVTAEREIENRLRVTVDHAPIGVALVDLQSAAHGRLLSVNAPFAALLGDPDPVAGDVSLLSVVHPDDADALRADLTLLATAQGSRTESEIRCLHPDGRVIWVLVTGAAVPSATGTPHLAVMHALDIGERKRVEGQLQHLADHDALTGLFNRRRFESELERTVSLVGRYGHESALLMIDLDGFKHVNDTLGHSYGDELLTRIASCLRGCLRETDVIGRLGGDEFAVVLASVTPEAAVTVAEKVVHAIAEHGTVVSDARHASVTGSIGVVAFDGKRGLDAEALLIEADLAMYAAKQSGRNRVTVARPGAAGSRRVAAERSWLHRLRAVLDEDRFELYAQPILPICAGGAPHHELLLRMRDEGGGLLAPATFLHNAERFDVIGEIDRWVFGRALALLSEHEDTELTLSVNVSGQTLGEPRLLDDLGALVDAHPSAAGRLIVEVTETAAIVNVERARAVARALRELGCRFALDDFGAGFASYAYLKHLAFDYLKIDGEFITALGEDPTDRLVVRSIVDLARGLGAQTIAEFVGDEMTVDVLRELGVDYGQGFHLGRPAPAADVLAAVRAGASRAL